MTKDRLLFALLKFGQKSHIIDMYKNEYLYFNRMSSFRSKTTDTSGRLDHREGNLSNLQIQDLTIKLPEREIDFQKVFKEFKAQYTTYPRTLKGNILLTYALLGDGDEQVNIDPRILNMGTSVLVINHHVSFLEMFDTTLKRMNIGFKRDFVKYYDHKTYDGSLTNFHKDCKFEYQSEYRIYLETEGDQPMKIKFPGLKKLTRIVHDWKDTTVNLVIK